MLIYVTRTLHTALPLPFTVIRLRLLGYVDLVTRICPYTRLRLGFFTVCYGLLIPPLLLPRTLPHAFWLRTFPTPLRGCPFTAHFTHWFDYVRVCVCLRYRCIWLVTAFVVLHAFSCRILRLPTRDAVTTLHVPCWLPRLVDVCSLRYGHRTVCVWLPAFQLRV